MHVNHAVRSDASRIGHRAILTPCFVDQVVVAGLTLPGNRSFSKPTMSLVAAYTGSLKKPRLHLQQPLEEHRRRHAVEILAAACQRF